MNDEDITLHGEVMAGLSSLVTNDDASRLFNQACDVARGLNHLSVDPIDFIIVALQQPNVYWRFAREVEPVTYVDAVRAARQHYDGPLLEGGDATVSINLHPYTPAFKRVAARLSREQHRWVSEQLANYNGVDTASWGVQYMLLDFCAESDSPAVKALELRSTTPSA